MHALLAFSITITTQCQRAAQGAARVLHVFSSSRKNCAMKLSPHFDIDCRITIFAFKLLANYEGNYECHDEITIVTIY